MESQKIKETPKFITSYRPPDALESQIMLVKTGKLPLGPFQNHRPHDFRQLNEDLPNMDTSYEKDPADLKFKLKHLDVLGAATAESNTRMQDIRTQRYGHRDDDWDMRLILPLLPWPPKQTTTTNRPRRSEACKAFLEHVEEKLSRSWKTGL
ncbi:uncharacterized protein si:dkey-30e9.6 [Nerophis ophidion]|uniref:uncharacterized protein si:dkey-30e9.6 n=1 Tax=Nerophis ophidion TaxID=159077 RepID=UPI002AE01A64|nr:uncharacterized protein si:dkey-30e9.6 [Nerophis ophidion]